MANPAVALLAGLSLLLCTGQVAAGTIIEIQSNGEHSTMITEGNQTRLNMSSHEYVIIDNRKHEVKVVDQQRHQVMVLNVAATDKTAANSNNGVTVSLRKMGAGQNVAGYKTQKFEYIANGKHCGVILASKQAYQEKGIKDFLAAMESMVKKQRMALGGFAGFVDDCTLADMQMTEQVRKMGLPMQTLKNGVVETEIKSIKVNVRLPADTFSIPASYTNITMEEKIKQATGMSGFQPTGQQGARPGMQQPGTQQPGMQQIQEMMRQMQQSGQITPEMMEQMRHSQQMMQQYQQPRR